MLEPEEAAWDGDMNKKKSQVTVPVKINLQKAIFESIDKEQSTLRVQVNEYMAGESIHWPVLWIL